MNLNPKEGDSSHASLDDVKGNVTNFMSQKEAQVLRTIDAFNRVMGTDFKTTYQCDIFSRENEGTYEILKAEAENSWEDFLSANMDLWKMGFYSTLRMKYILGTIVAFLLGWGIGNVLHF